MNIDSPVSISWQSEHGAFGITLFDIKIHVHFNFEIKINIEILISIFKFTSILKSAFQFWSSRVFSCLIKLFLRFHGHFVKRRRRVRQYSYIGAYFIHWYICKGVIWRFSRTEMSSFNIEVTSSILKYHPISILNFEFWMSLLGFRRKWPHRNSDCNRQIDYG